MLRIAVPNKGQLAEPALSMLREAGYLAHTNPVSYTHLTLPTIYSV